MDVYCPKCSEPWDMDTLHEAAGEQERTFEQVWARFRRLGCPAIDPGGCNVMGRPDPEAAEIYALLGDDVDGAASELADLRDGYYPGGRDVEHSQAAGYWPSWAVTRRPPRPKPVSRISPEQGSLL